MAKIKSFEFFLNKLLKGFRSVEKREPNNLEMILIKQEAGNKARDAAKVIEVDFGKPFKQEMEDIKGRMSGIKSLSDELEKMSKGYDEYYGTGTSQKYKEKEILEKINKNNKEAIRAFKSKNPEKELMEDVDFPFDGPDDPKKYYTGGRVPFSKGKVVLEGLMNLANKIAPDSTKIGQTSKPMAEKTELRQAISDFQNREKNKTLSDEFNKKYTVTQETKISSEQVGSLDEFHADFIKETGINIPKENLKQAWNVKKSYPFNTPIIDKTGKLIGQEATQQMYPKSKKFMVKDYGQLSKEIDFMREGKLPSGERAGIDVPPVPEGFKLSREKLIENFPEIGLDEIDEVMKLDKETQARYIMMLKNRRQDPELYDELLLKYGDTINFQGEFDKAIRRKKNASGGRAEFYTGGMVDVEPSLSDIGHGSDSLMARTRLISPNNQATTSTGLNYLLAEDNDNIRVPFAKGKGVDLLRRGFLKTMGTAGAGLAALKSGILGFGKEAAPVVEKAVETVSETAQNVPPYFLNLVNKIKNLGSKFDGPKERAESYRYKDYEMDIDLDTGAIDIKKTREAMIPGYDEAGVAEEVYMTYKPGMIDETTKSKKTIDEYEEFTARPDMDGKMKDVEGGVPDEVIEEGTMFEDNIKDFGKADGGRIGFSKGKLVFENVTKFLEKVFGKENMAEMPNRDPEMFQGILEVVDMFRNRDKEGLIKYMKKYLPHKNDAEIEEFIIGSDGTEGMQGQLIRLGSGRDYTEKMEMIKNLDNRKKLDNLDVTEEMIRKPNALGGIQTMLGE
jgi:hypothetical protein